LFHKVIILLNGPPCVVIEEEAYLLPVFRVALVYLVPVRVIGFQTAISA
jgi:hypothetical protein